MGAASRTEQDSHCQSHRQQERRTHFAAGNRLEEDRHFLARVNLVIVASAASLDAGTDGRREEKKGFANGSVGVSREVDLSWKFGW